MAGRRIITCAIGVAALATALATGGCRKPTERSEATVSIVCSMFPVWLFTRNVTRDVPGVSVTLLLPATLGCPHDYVVTPTDVRRLEKADILVVSGNGLDDFAADQYRSLHPAGKLVVASEPDGDEGHHGDHANEHGHTGNEADAHQFASPRRAAEMVKRIGAGLAEADPRNAERYTRNAQTYARRLVALHEELRNAVSALPNTRIITQHSVFDLLAQDIGLDIVGVIQAHAGHDPSAQDVMALVAKAKSARAAAVMTEPQYPPKLGRTIAREAGIRTGVLDPVAGGPEDAQLDYYEETMRANLRTLQNVLGP